MNFLKFLGRLPLLAVLALPTGCVSDLDLDQSNEVTIAPKVDIDLIYLKLLPELFVSNDEVEVTEVHQITALDFIKDRVTQQNLNQVTFNAMTRSTYTQSFQTTVRFLDAQGAETYAITIDTQGSDDGSLKEYNDTRILIGDELAAFKTSVAMEINSIIILDGQPIEGFLEFKSKAILYFEF